MLSVFTFFNMMSFYYVITGRDIEEAIRRSIKHMIITWILLWIVATANLMLTGSAEKAMYVFVQLEQILNTTKTFVSDAQQQIL